MLDVSRNRLYTMDSLKQMIRKLVLLKYNQIQLYTEHIFAYQGHKQVWREASPFTEEIRELDLFCLDRGMELVPNQNSFGHMEGWLKYKDYHCIAETPDGLSGGLGGSQSLIKGDSPMWLTMLSSFIFHGSTGNSALVL